MKLKLAIIADDLTGALDTSTPFVAAGLRVAVAIGLDGIAAALASGADIVAINTASRALPQADATARTIAAATALRDANPPILFKKIDSRLKGHPGAQAHAVADASARSALIVAPAIPDQQRPTLNGCVTGRGVDAPIPIAPLFAHPSRPVTVIDAQSQADLDRLVATQDWSTTLAVGARGLGIAFANRLGHPTIAAPFQPDAKTLFALGSRDPITAAQIARLAQAGIPVRDAPAGLVSLDGTPLPLVVRCSGPLTDAPEIVAERFAAGLLTLVTTEQPATIVTGGGDTVLALLQALGITMIEPQGEAAPGLPWFWITAPDRRRLRCVVKSGGFGDTEVLASLLATPKQTTQSADNSVFLTARHRQ